MDLNVPTVAGQLEKEIEGPGPSLIVLSGLRGAGTTRVLREVASRDPAAVYYRALPLSDPDHREALGAALAPWTDDDAPTEGLDWPRLLASVAAGVARTRRRLVLLVDDASRLVDGRARFPGLLAEGWAQVRARGLPVHLVLAGRTSRLESGLRPSDGPLASLLTQRLEVLPRDYREVARGLPGWAPLDRIVAWAVFGGRAGRLRHVDPRVSLATNVQRLVLEPDGPLFEDGLRELTEAVSSPARYVGVLRSLASGAREWGDIVEGTSDVESGGQVAPYLARLEEIGLVRAERSLDAGPRSRRRRYFLTDPFLAFWYGLVLPHVSAVEVGRGADVWTRHVRGELAAHIRRQLPLLVRSWLERYADERLPAVAREVGGLWGRKYDLDPAATLRTGPVLYGAVHWTDQPLDEADDDALEEQVRATRYGFGREARLRLLVSSGGFRPGLVRRAARDRLLHLVGPEDLLGPGPGKDTEGRRPVGHAHGGP